MAQSVKNLPVGSKIKFGNYQVENESPQPIIWQIADKNHTGYPTNSVTLITEKIIDLRAFDAIEPSNSDASRKKYGNNRYSFSNIRQWLNKSGYPWFSPSHSADTAPTDANTNNRGTGYDDKTGFLSNFTSEEINVILDTTLTVVKPSIDGGGSETVTDKVFLPSSTEMGLADENSIAEGSKLALFTDDASRIGYMTQQGFDNSLSTSKPTNVNTAWYYWLRTPVSAYSYSARDVFTSGVLSNNDACNGYYGVRPALNVTSDILVSDSVDSDGCYVVTFNQSPTLSGSDRDLGVKTTSFTIDYSMNDNDLADVVTVVEKLDTNILRTINNAVRNQVYSMPIDISTLGVGSHKVTITASDGKSTITRTYTFSIETLQYIITLDKPITISSSDFIEGKNLIVKVNGIELPITSTDSEKMIYKGKTNGVVDLEISSKGKQTLDKIAYTVS